MTDQAYTCRYCGEKFPVPSLRVDHEDADEPTIGRSSDLH